MLCKMQTICFKGELQHLPESAIIELMKRDAAKNLADEIVRKIGKEKVEDCGDFLRFSFEVDSQLLDCLEGEPK